MSWVLVLAGAVGVVVVALLAVGGEVFTLSRQPRQALFDLDEAVDRVADRLPFEVSAKLSYDEVRTLLAWHLEHLRDQGVPTNREARSDGGPVVVADAEAAAYLLARAEEAGLDVDAADVDAVVDAELSYFRDIGAIGPQVEGPDDPG
ncbi:hypothetical protein BH18ACT4_BH18ACT4_15180 [soil metagenome]